MGFIPDIERICKLVPFTRQTLFFTATMPPEIRRIVDTFLHNPVKVEVTRPATTVATTAQWLAPSGRDAAAKRETLRRLIRAEGFKNAIVFCNRKREVAVLHRSLLRHGFSAVALHGDLDQPARMAALDSFRRGETPLLVASDVAARGLDIPDVSHVFNFDVPHHPDDYVHRIGRTGRAGKSGIAITIVAPSDHKAVAAIEKLIGQKIAAMPRSAGAAEESRAEPVRAFEKPRHPRGEARASSPPRHRHPHAPAKAAPAKVTRLDEARPARAEAKPARPQHRAETDGAHLPAFLLRPIRAKA
jgi:superfamily II DNA/RNA helicase